MMKLYITNNMYACTHNYL